MKKNLLFLLLSVALVVISCNKQDEGNYSNGPGQANISYLGNNISFYNPTSVALDTSGNVYVADFRNNLIREINIAGVGSTLAGTGAVGNANGAASVASFDLPTGVALDKYGNVYVADSNNNLIREISTSGMVSTFAGTGAQGTANGAASAATFNYPEGVAVDTLGNLYVADYGNNMIREISAAGLVSTLAGNGTAGANNGVDTAATFYEPSSVAVDVSGNVYVADFGNDMIRKISPTAGVTTFAGSGNKGVANGAGTAASFNGTTGVAVDLSGNVYVADYSNGIIREITPAGAVTTVAGTTGLASSVYYFTDPYGVAVDASGNIYVAAYGTNAIEKITRPSALAARNKRVSKK